MNNNYGRANPSSYFPASFAHAAVDATASQRLG